MDECGPLNHKFDGGEGVIGPHPRIHAIPSVESKQFFVEFAHEPHIS